MRRLRLLTARPSYLPALEQHIAGLRADRETAHAIGAAEYVINNLTAEIDAFTHVAEPDAPRPGRTHPEQNARKSKHASKPLAAPGPPASSPSSTLRPGRSVRG